MKIEQQTTSKSSMMKPTFRGMAIIKYFLGILLLANGLPGIALATVPATPTGLCIQSTSGTQCAANPVATTTTNVAAPTSVNPNNFHPGYYMIVGPNDGINAFNVIANNPDFVGVKKYYNWRNLEPQEGVYDFSQIESDLAYLQSIGKRLFPEIQITNWDTAGPPETPSYMWSDSKYGGNLPYYGAFQYTATSPWRAIIWNANVQSKLDALYAALGQRFDGEPYFEGINLGETSMEAGPGFSSAGVENAFKTMSLAAKNAFPDKVVFLQVNFGAFDLSAMRQWLSANGIGFGAPDTFGSPDTTLLTLNTTSGEWYDYNQYHSVVPTERDVQWDNYTRCCDASGNNFTAAEILDFAVQAANPWYMFWVKRDDFFTPDVVPAINNYGPLPAARDFYNSLN